MNRDSEPNVLFIFNMLMTFVPFHRLFQIQFFMILVHWLVLLFHSDCGYPKFPVAIMVPQNLFMLALFGDFYYKTYIQEKKERPKGVDGKKRNDDDDYNNNSPIAVEHTNNGTAKTMANGNGVTCRKSVNYCANGTANGTTNGTANGISISS